MKRPFLWFLVGIISGIVFGRYVDCTCLKLFLFFVVYKLLAFALFKKFSNKVMLAIPIIAVIGAVMCTYAMNMDKNIVKLTDTDRQMLYGTVISTDISQNGRTVINTDVDYISDMKNSENENVKIHAKQFYYLCYGDHRIRHSSVYDVSGNDLQFPRRSDGTDLRIYRHGGLSEPYGGYSGGTESRTCRVYERGRLQRRRGGHQSAVGHSKRRAASDRSGDYRRCGYRCRRNIDRYSGTSSQRRLSGYRNAGFR